MIYTGKNNNAGEFDIVVRVGKFPTQGKKLVIQKGDTIISIPVDDCNAFVNAIYEVCQFRSQTIATFEPFVAKDYDLCNTCPAR